MSQIPHNQSVHATVGFSAFIILMLVCTRVLMFGTFSMAGGIFNQIVTTIPDLLR